MRPKPRERHLRLATRPVPRRTGGGPVNRMVFGGRGIPPKEDQFVSISPSNLADDFGANPAFGHWGKASIQT